APILQAYARRRAPSAALLEQERGHSRAESKNHAGLLEALPHRAHDLGQPVAPDVVTRVGQDRRRCTEMRKDPYHVARVATLVRARVELAVAVRARAAFAEAVVAVRIDSTPAVDRFEVVSPGLHRFSAIDDHARDSAARELVGAEHA